jgi:plastocyanin
MTLALRVLSIGILAALISACGEAAATVTPAPGAGATDGAVPLAITAQDIAFKPASLTAPAGRLLQVTFDNRDGGVPHNLVLMAGPDLTTELVKSEIVTGPATQVVSIPGLIPEIYQFTCTVHPNMTAKLVIGG